MRKTWLYCLIVVLAPFPLLAFTISPEEPSAPTRVSLMRPAAGPVPFRQQSMPPQVGLESYSTKPEHEVGFFGGGFRPNEVVDVRLNTQDTPPTLTSGRLLTRTLTNAGGNLAGRTSVPMLPAGEYPLSFVGIQSKQLVLVDLTILGFVPWVVLDNYAPAPRAWMGFRGTDFAPGEPVQVYLNQPGKQPLTTLSADRDGRFEARQAWRLPDLTGEQTLVFVGAYTQAVIAVAFKVLPTMPTAGRLLAAPFPAPGGACGCADAARHAPADRHSAPPAVLAGSLSSSTTPDSGQLDPVTIALLVLVGWFILSVLLVLPLVVPQFWRRGKKQQAPGPSPLPGRSQAGSQTNVQAEAIFPLSARGRASSSADPPAAQVGGLIAACFCPWCGLRNSSGDPGCVGCKRRLPEIAVVAPGGEASQPEDSLIADEMRHPALGMQVSNQSDRGRKRTDRENEDSYLAVTGTRRASGQLQPFGLFVVADGMGGQANGQEASRLTIELLFECLGPNLAQEDWAEEELAPLMEEAIQSANQMLYRRNQHDQTNMGCTITAALVTSQEATIWNVGDSRTYLLGPQAPLRRITVDHSIVESLVSAGIIKRDDVYTHPGRGRIYRSLGQGQWVQIDAFRQPVASGDQLLLCSDGLWEMIRDPLIETTLRQQRDITEASGRLIRLANENGGLDNITAILVRLTGEVGHTRRPGIERCDSNRAHLLRQGLFRFFMSN